MHDIEIEVDDDDDNLVETSDRLGVHFDVIMRLGYDHLMANIMIMLDLDWLVHTPYMSWSSYLLWI